MAVWTHLHGGEPEYVFHHSDRETSPAVSFCDDWDFVKESEGIEGDLEKAFSLDTYFHDLRTEEHPEGILRAMQQGVDTDDMPAVTLQTLFLGVQSPIDGRRGDTFPRFLGLAWERGAVKGIQQYFFVVADYLHKEGFAQSWAEGGQVLDSWPADRPAFLRGNMVQPVRDDLVLPKHGNLSMNGSRMYELLSNPGPAFGSTPETQDWGQGRFADNVPVHHVREVSTIPGVSKTVQPKLFIY
ncbi:MAG: hypothetical protein OXR66_05045 [Candidatus Woesearchaeota archaeon]|nr:hypothetical protein [Candidatus Woesearchaeota archaeon]